MTVCCQANASISISLNLNILYDCYDSLRLYGHDVDTYFVVTTGGWLFEEWFECMTPIRIRILFHTFMTQAKQEHRNRIDTNLSEIFTDKYGSYFHSYILLSLHTMGTAVQHQLFYSTMVMDYRGASRTGLDIMYKKGLGLPLTTYGRYLKSELTQAEEMIK